MKSTVMTAVVICLLISSIGAASTHQNGKLQIGLGMSVALNSTPVDALPGFARNAVADASMVNDDRSGRNVACAITVSGQMRPKDAQTKSNDTSF